MNELEAAIKRAKVGKTFPPTSNVPAQMAQEMDPPVAVIYPKVLEIKRAVADYFSIEILDIDCSRRNASIAKPRHIAMYLCSRLTLHSLAEIGRRFGGRDHATVHHACAKLEKQLIGLGPKNRELREQVEEIKKTILGKLGKVNGQA